MYDAIIVGARCAGAPTAMLLARRGFKVLLVDKATFPSDTISTYILWPHGAERSAFAAMREARSRSRSEPESSSAPMA
jgi:flavin-dependent dehydrogenase